MQKSEITMKLTNKDIIREKLLVVINDYQIKLETLNKITQIDVGWFSDYINKKNRIFDLPIEKQGLLVHLLNMLSAGMTLISEDERVKGVIDVLIEQFGLECETISLYAGLKRHDIEGFMQDTATLDYEKKYKLAVTCLMLHYLFKEGNGSERKPPTR